MPRALIVEDEPEANKLLGMLLRLRGYKTDSAFTGQEALRMVEASPPDIIFLDLMLPDLNGYEVCKRLKSSKRTSLVPLVIVTARLSAENRLESFRLGADDYISKPYTPDQIFQSMDQAVRWVDAARSGQIQGTVAFREGDDAEILRQLGQLRNLLLARTSMDFEAATLINKAIKEIWCLATESKISQSGQGQEVARLEYGLSNTRLVLTFQQAMLWMIQAADLRSIDAASALASARFDQISADPSGCSLTLVKTFPSH